MKNSSDNLEFFRLLIVWYNVEELELGEHVKRARLRLKGVLFVQRNRYSVIINLDFVSTTPYEFLNLFYLKSQMCLNFYIVIIDSHNKNLLCQLILVFFYVIPKNMRPLNMRTTKVESLSYFRDNIIIRKETS